MSESGFTFAGLAGEQSSEPTGEPTGTDFFARLGGIDPAAATGGSDSGSSGGSGGSSGGDRDSNGDAFDASIHVSPDKRNADGSFRRKRGRKSGASLSRGKSSARAPSVNAIENSLIGIHAILAAATGFEDIRLADPDESRPLAMAVADVAKHYNIPVLDEKVLAWVGLVVVCGKVYGPKAALIKMELQERKERKQEQAQGTVINFPLGPQPDSAA